MPDLRKLSLFTVLGCTVLGGAAAALKGISAFRMESRRFEPSMHKVPAPPDAAALSLRTIELQVRARAVRGWYLPAKNGAAVVFVHGAPSDRTELMPEARALAQRGFGALLFDIPGHGESPGKPSWGAPAREALRAAVDYLALQPEVTRIAAFGFSMGSTIVASEASTDPRLAAIVLAGAFTTIEAQIEHEFGTWFRALPAATVLPAKWAARARGLAIDELRAIDSIASLSPRPVLVIAGSEDQAVPEPMARELYAAAREPKHWLMVPGAGHGKYESAMGEAYFDSLASFLETALLPKGP